MLNILEVKREKQFHPVVIRFNRGVTIFDKRLQGLSCWLHCLMVVHKLLISVCRPSGLY